ncbi:hypothetical protein ACIPLR_17585 [Herbaspirillum huttiense]|uniref:hypothetical protein n=1 Tax=Herbaspirillum huttiense TaxID=863372 RepID=UPI0038213C9F
MKSIIWLIAGNKGSVGKSAVAKAFIEWLEHNRQRLYVVDGDTRTPDVAQVYCVHYETLRPNLQEQRGWEQLADWLPQKQGHIVANLPEGVTDRAIEYFESFAKIAGSQSFEVRVLFVMNTLPDGISLIRHLDRHFDTVAVKNLHFGRPLDFVDFNLLYEERDANTVYFPAMNRIAMTAARNSGLTFEEFTTQRNNSVTNLLSNKIVVAEWRQRVFEAFDDVLAGDLNEQQD